MKKIYKTDGGLFTLDEASRAAVRDAGYELIEVRCKSPEDIIFGCSDASALMVTVEPITERVLQSLPKLEVVSRCGVGLDTIDIDAATRFGIQVTNVPDANIEEVAAHTIALALNLVRRVHQFDGNIRQGSWTSPDISRGMRRLSSMTFGIVGCGRIGERVCSMAVSMGFRVLVSTVLASEQIRARELGAEVAEFSRLISDSDIVSLHIPLLESTKGIIDGKVMRDMKRGSFLLNVSRGGLVDEEALASNLHAGHLSGAALDVFAEEPLSSDSPLRKVDGLIMTPHIAYLSEDSLEEVSRKMTAEVLSVLQGNRPKYAVNVVERK